MKGIKIEKCPRCGNQGLMVEKPTVSKGHRYVKTYIAHYLENGISAHGKRVNRVRWCYLNKAQIESLNAAGVLTQTRVLHKNVTQTKRTPKQVALRKQSLGRDLNPRPPPYQGEALTGLGHRGIFSPKKTCIKR